MSIETILLGVGTDGDEQVRRLAEETVDVAGPCEAEVVLAHVFTEEALEESRERLNIDPGSEAATPDGVAKRHATIRDLADAMEESDVEYRVRGAVGDHGQAIADLAEEETADRVVVGGRKRSPTGKAVFGSTAQTVMLSSPCPVTFVREDTR
ncbi:MULTISPECIES: universal stress protein [Halopenitus]|uniref:Nucleotide-binding universal stress protein, UspA family n=1 Tax=Halopenitus malekzadehii TaxID=1267564 RepID=A0A1H6HQP9_9EURY|nr:MULTISPECIES: universal stress protein [Halopenitus]SEH36504.1 Nucleotide-binding universal stress protein, UspA family [Halopenitus malekzadehii]